MFLYNEFRINMNKIKLLLSFIIIFSSFALTNDGNEEIQTIEKDGIIYNVNNDSKHLTPISNNDVIINNESDPNKETFTYKVTPYFGHISPIGENLRNIYNPGFSIGFLIETDNSFEFIDKNWFLSGNLVFSRLNAKSGTVNRSNYNIATMEVNMATDFGPIIMGVGFGLSPVSSSYLFDSGGGNVINVRETNTFVCMSLNLGYKLIEQEDYNLILNMNLKEILGGPEEALGSSTSELFGLNLKFSKKIS